MKFGKEVSKSIKKEIDSKPVFDAKYLKTKIESYNGKINTILHSNQVPKKDSQCICLSVILIDSGFRTGINYYLQVFLEECKYMVQESKVLMYIIDDIELPSDYDRENSDEQNSDEENSDEENSDEGYSDEENVDEKNSDKEN